MSTRTSVRSWIALQQRYMPMLARIVVMSQVPSSAITSSSAASTSSRVMYTSVCSAPMKSATMRAYLRSIASVSMPMAKVRIGWFSSRAEIAQTKLLSSPPESRKPSGASASSRLSTPRISFSRIFLICTVTVFSQEQQHRLLLSKVWLRLLYSSSDPGNQW